MKKIYFSLMALAVLALSFSCTKEKEIATSERNEEKTITISASIDEATKSTYTEDGIFSWESDDEISYLLRHDDGHYDGNALKTTGSGSIASFSGATSANYFTPIDLALYPKNRYQSGVNANTFAVDNTASVKTLTASLAGTITARDDRLSRIIPMIGKKTGEDASGTVDHYHFYPVTGVLKVSFANLPSSATQIRLEVPDAATYPLNGTFNIDTSRETPEIKATDVVEGKAYAIKYMNFTYKGASDAFYFPLPTGTIPAGKLTVSITDGTNVLYAVTNKIEINLSRGVISELPTITVPSLKIKLSGTADNPKATFYYSGDISTVRYYIATSYSQVYSSDPSVSSGQTINLTNSSTAKYWLNYVAYNSSGDAIRGTESSPLSVTYYAITGDDATALVGNFTHTVAAGCVAGGSNAPSTSNFTIALSDDPMLGQVMVTNFDGMDCVNKVPGIYDSSNKTISWDNYNTYFDPNEPYKRFVRSSGVAIKLNFVFTSTTTFYADSGFGYKTGKNDGGGWQYYYNAGSEHVYTKEE